MINLKAERVGTVTLYVGPWCPQSPGVDHRRVHGETVIGDDFLPHREPFRVIRRCMKGRTTQYQVFKPGAELPEVTFLTVGRAMRWCAEKWREE